MIHPDGELKKSTIQTQGEENPDRRVIAGPE
jgi:hypothetical protein